MMEKRGLSDAGVYHIDMRIDQILGNELTAARCFMRTEPITGMGKIKTARMEKAVSGHGGFVHILL